MFYLFSDGEINMVMEYMEGGSLDLVMKKIGKIEEQYSRKITHAVRFLCFKTIKNVQILPSVQ